MEQAPICPPKTRSDLEWDRILLALAERAQSALGKRAAQQLAFAATRDDALAALAEVKEAVDLDIAGEPVPVGTLPEADDAIERARIGAPLSADELRAILGVLTAGRTLRSFLRLRKDRAPRLFEVCSLDPALDYDDVTNTTADSTAGLDELERTLDQSFEPDGSLSDRASPELAAFRSERRSVRDRIVRKLEDVLSRSADLLQDGYYTERDGRYVVPVRADAHERFPGIVHGASGSGATLFVEPRAIVDQGNQLKMLDAQVERAIRAVLAALSAKVAAAAPAIADTLRALAHADVRAAAAHLTRDLALTFPEIAAATEPFAITLRNARHPLLVLEGVAVVPSDLEARSGEAIVVSGPNAGGKTVALKTLGLAALMVRAGLPVPARDGSRVSFVSAVLTDVGDDQNLHKNLSTFSAHVRNLAAILDETHPGALVLLDELAGGTDPREGEALAAAVLDSLAARGGAVVCTTHYEGLKALALGDPRFKNASVGFDIATMSPTFRLALGVPGPSSALAVARRFGIPGLLIERAERFLTRENVAFEETVQKLVDERHALERTREELQREADTLRSQREKLDAELERLRSKERTTLTDEGQELLVQLRRARDELRGAQAKLRGKPTDEDTRAVARVIETVAQKAAIGGELALREDPIGDSRGPVAAGTVKVGMRVYVPKLRAEAEVIEVLSSGQLRVAAGAMKLTTRVDEVRAALAPEPSKSPSKTVRTGKLSKPPAKSIAFDAAADPDVPIQTPDNSVDLRGLRAHEAEAMAEQFLDRMMGSGRRVAFLIHGHGTGALRESIRQSMKQSPYVARSRPGEQREGGDGVTIVWLR